MKAWTAEELSLLWRHNNIEVAQMTGRSIKEVGDRRLQANLEQDGISWDALQEIKGAVGYADRDAVEIYPRDADVVNVANMRHLWITPEPIAFAWRK